MKRFLCLAFIALAVFIESYECKKKLLPQIKMTGSVTHYFNKEYVKELEYTVTPHNETYNNMRVLWVVIKDLPVEVTVYNKIYVTDRYGDNSKLLLDIPIQMCRENKNRHLLPKIDVLPESTMGTKCLRKGTYNPKDMGQTRFEILIPNIEKKGKYYKAHYRMGTEDMTVLDVTFYSKFGGYVRI